MPNRYKFDAERLAYWYFRLNGFLTIENFILHDEEGGQQRTDIDLIALRLPHRKEALRGFGDHSEWMEDDRRFTAIDVPFAAFVEVATGQCKLNGPWTSREQDNLPRALRALGAIPESSLNVVAHELYESGRYASDQIAIGLVSIGDTENPSLEAQMPEVMQVRWTEVTGFMFDRLRIYRRIKREHPQWDLDGHLLWRAFEENCDDASAFAAALVMVTERPVRGTVEKYCQSRIYGQQ